jgi:hypothetical protein
VITILILLQVVASPTIVILTTLEVSFLLLGDIYSTGITYDRQNIFIAQVTGTLIQIGIGVGCACLSGLDKTLIPYLKVIGIADCETNFVSQISN